MSFFPSSFLSLHCNAACFFSKMVIEVLFYSSDQSFEHYVNNILIYIQQDATLRSLFYLETALHVSGGTITHYQEGKQLYLQHPVFVIPWKSWNWFECAVGGVRHPQHTQTSSNSSTIAAGSNNGVTNTRCCRYSCVRSRWWVIVPPETCRAVSR